MKEFHGLMGKIGLCIFFSVTMLSCVNKLTEEGEDILNDGNIPLRFVATIEEITKTRMVGSTFSEGDEVGLFAMAGTTTIKEERYVDNLFFKRSANSVFESDELIYYPDDGTALSLISYYPYQKEGVAMGESIIKVAVSPKQNELGNYSHSDFLVASKENVSATNEAISMTYKHKFFKLKISIVSEKEGEIESISAANPQISLSGFYTNAIYDFQQNTYMNFTDDENIVPYGEWQLVDDRLIGKEFILIPQETASGYQYINLEIGGKTYISLLPESLQLQSGKQRELEITFKAENDELISNIDGEISDWEGTEVDKVTTENIHEYVDISGLTFEESSVYKVSHAGKKVAEVCKELLVTSDKTFQAIVAYPMKDDVNVDLSKGIVLKILGEEGKVHGGTVSWNMEEHSLMYIQGNLAARTFFFVLKNGQLALKKSSEDEILSVAIRGDIIHDVRGKSIQDYPIVKIGTQYWMRGNLAASRYLDGTEITQLDVMSLDATGYILSETGNYYYSQNSVLTDKLLPANAKIPTWEDWDLLKKYLAGNASLLKAGIWKAIIEDGKEKEVKEANNLSGFNASPVGLCWNSHLSSGYEGKYLSYWTMNESEKGMDEKIFFLRSSTNEFEQGDTGPDKAYAIRCIRK